MIPIQWKQNDKKTMHVNEAEKRRGLSDLAGD